jgi:hypothetical protein
MFRTLSAALVMLPLSTALAQGIIQQQELLPLPAAPPSAAPAPPPQDRTLHLQRDPIAAGPAPGTAVPPPSGEPPAAAETARVFCDQSVSFRLAPPDSVPEPYRPFVGIFSDASWTPQLCAALVVQNVQPDGTASIVYAYGPMGSNVRAPGGVLNGTGIVRDGELRFQNSDGSQFAFKPLYSDLDGRLTTPKGQSYEAVFKRTF